jgi:hypothetical protein
LCINSNNFVGIGTATPTSRLDVNGTGNFANRISVGTVSQGSIRITGVGDTRYYCYNGGAVQEWLWGQKSSTNHNWTLSTMNSGVESDRVTVDTSGNMGINTTSPSQRLHVVGNILASGDITAFSDKRLKTNINIINDALAKVHSLTGYTFNVEHSADTNKNKVTPQHTGLLAQEVLNVLPEAVHQDNDGYYSLAYGNIVGLLVQAIKELDEKYKKELQDIKEKLIMLV